MTDEPQLQAHARVCPSAPLLHLCMMLTGVATALLGPVLPLLSHRWHLLDQQTGLLLLAQFVGSCSGGLTVSKYLRRSLILGLAAAALGFMAFACAPGLLIACVSLLAGGWGCGQVITACNIVAGRRYGNQRGSALALLNFSWSLGAMLSPLLAAWLTPYFALGALLACFAFLFVIALAGVSIEFVGQPNKALFSLNKPTNSQSCLLLRTAIYFVVLLFLYGGIETSLGAWLTTYALRFGGRTLVRSEYTTLVFWASLTVGRAISSLLLLRIGELSLQRATLLVTVLCTIGLVAAKSGLAITLFAVFLGVSLAPVFPAVFSLLMGERPSTRQAGVLLAMSGLGAAILPWLTGVVSTHSGSLQIALAVPLASAVLLLALSIFSLAKLHPSVA